jgi:hypothetical protein
MVKELLCNRERMSIVYTYRTRAKLMFLLLLVFLRALIVSVFSST